MKHIGHFETLVNRFDDAGRLRRRRCIARASCIASTATCFRALPRARRGATVEQRRHEGGRMNLDRLHACSSRAPPAASAPRSRDGSQPRAPRCCLTDLSAGAARAARGELRSGAPGPTSRRSPRTSRRSEGRDALVAARTRGRRQRADQRRRRQSVRAPRPSKAAARSAAALSINAVAPMLLCHALLPVLGRPRAAHIVNVGSTFGSIGFPGLRRVLGEQVRRARLLGSPAARARRQPHPRALRRAARDAHRACARIGSAR